jgi:hypothetical protein
MPDGRIFLVEELREVHHPTFYRSFFFSKKVLRCHNCQPATTRQTRSDMIPNHATLEFVSSFKSRISASLETIQNQIQNLPYSHSYNDIHQKLLSPFWVMQIVRQPISPIWLLSPFLLLQVATFYLSYNMAMQLPMLMQQPP